MSGASKQDPAVARSEASAGSLERMVRRCGILLSGVAIGFALGWVLKPEKRQEPETILSAITETKEVGFFQGSRRIDDASQVMTDRGVFFMSGYASGEFGAKVEITRDKDGKSWLGVEGSELKHALLE